MWGVGARASREEGSVSGSPAPGSLSLSSGHKVEALPAGGWGAGGEQA